MFMYRYIAHNLSVCHSTPQHLLHFELYSVSSIYGLYAWVFLQIVPTGYWSNGMGPMAWIFCTWLLRHNLNAASFVSKRDKQGENTRNPGNSWIKLSYWPHTLTGLEGWPPETGLRRYWGGWGVKGQGRPYLILHEMVEVESKCSESQNVQFGHLKNHPSSW